MSWDDPAGEDGMTTPPLDSHAVLKTCRRCGFLHMAQDTICPRCKHPVSACASETVVVTRTSELDRTPTVLPTSDAGNLHFGPGDCAVLQVLPSAACLVLSLDAPLTLGRGAHEIAPFLDLSSFNAAKHGLSRHHCLLFRDEYRLYAVDLLSTNGTYLDGNRLHPERAYPIADGARLVLGTLHLFVFFMARD